MNDLKVWEPSLKYGKKYDIERLFKERTQKKEVEYVTEKMAMVEYKKSIFTKIKNWLKRNF